MGNIKRYATLFEASFGIMINVDEITALLNANRAGIETLAGIVYKYILQLICDKFSENDDIRLQDLLTCIAITTIFFDDKGKIDTSYHEDKLPVFSEYDYVFTLNYVEFWDKEHIAKPLHGYVDLSLIDDETTMLVSSPRMHYENYKQAVEIISKSNNVKVVDLGQIIFAPSEIVKEKLICVEGLYPSNRLFPAPDLFRIGRRKLYQELINVDELDVLGMSPYGDESLIAIINTRSKVRLFVYKKDTNCESKDWMKKLTGEYEILDSSLI